MRPFLPAAARYTLEQLEIYGHGYYEALAAALRVMKPAATRWEARMETQKPVSASEFIQRPRARVRPADETPDPIARAVFVGIVIGVGVLLLELIVLAAAAIHELLR